MFELRSRGARVWAACAALWCGAVGAATLRPLAAQLPDAPAAQSAFPAPGLALAVDAAYGNGRFAPAVAVATGVRRLQLTAAVGLPGAPDGYARRGVSAGARLAGRVYRTANLGMTVFAGVAAERLRADVGAGVPLGATSTMNGPTGSTLQVPVGLAAGVRRVIGDHPVAFTIVPMAAYTRWKVSDSTRSRVRPRVAALGEVAATSRIGIGVGVEVGAAGPGGSPYARRASSIGAGVSYALRRAVAR